MSSRFPYWSTRSKTGSLRCLIRTSARTWQSCATQSVSQSPCVLCFTLSYFYFRFHSYKQTLIHKCMHVCSEISLGCLQLHEADGGVESACRKSSPHICPGIYHQHRDDMRNEACMYVCMYACEVYVMQGELRLIKSYAALFLSAHLKY